MKSRYLATLLMAAVLPSQAIAQTAKPCITEAEARHVIATAMPDIISGVVTSCGPSLPQGAFLKMSGPAFATRLKPQADAAWPKARPVLLKMAGPQGKLFEQFPDSAARPLFSTLIATGFSEKMKLDQCPVVDRALAALAPLPDENLIELALIVAVGASSRPVAAGKPNPLAICPAASGKPLPTNQPSATTATK